jgi:putative hemolysin
MDKFFPLPILAIFLFILAVASFVFSASETSIICLSRIRLRHMVARGAKRAQSIQRLVSKLDKFIAAILVGNNFVNIAISAILTAFFVRKFGYNWGIVISTLASASFIVVLCEITPKILATKHTERTALFVAPLMELVVKILQPVIYIFIGISNFILKTVGLGPPKKSPVITEEELRMMIEVGKEEGVLSEQERKMLHRIFEFGDTKVAEVMVPKEKIIAVNIGSSAEEVLNIFAEEGHARLLVYSGSIDNIVGVLYARDLLYILRDKGLFLLQDLLHAPYYAPLGMCVNELLIKFQTEKIQIAVIVDDKNKTQGIVTLEDLTEEIVGEIEERHARRSPLESKN